MTSHMVRCSPILWAALELEAESSGTTPREAMELVLERVLIIGDTSSMARKDGDVIRISAAMGRILRQYALKEWRSLPKEVERRLFSTFTPEEQAEIMKELDQ